MEDKKTGSAINENDDKGNEGKKKLLAQIIKFGFVGATSFVIDYIRVRY